MTDLPEEPTIDALLIRAPQLPAIPITEHDTLNTVKRADLQISSMVLQGLSIAWSRAIAVDDFCKLALTTMKTLEYRRKLLCMQYGSESYKSGNGIVDPLD